MVGENDYWQLKYQEAANDLDASDVRLVMSFGGTVKKDGDKWCCLIGSNLQEGTATFGSSAMNAVRDMVKLLMRGKLDSSPESGK